MFDEVKLRRTQSAQRIEYANARIVSWFIEFVEFIGFVGFVVRGALFTVGSL